MFWYEEEVKGLEKKKQSLKTTSQSVFYGSSSIRLWQNLEVDFPDINALNMGFGGSTLAACVWYFERIFSGLNPEKIIIYAGDNDIGDGRLPEEVFLFFLQLANIIQQKFGHIPCFYISLKPSISRWNLLNSIKYTNSLIENSIIQNHPNWTYINIFDKMLNNQGQLLVNLLQTDGLHLSNDGYAVWKNIIHDAIIKNSII